MSSLAISPIVKTAVYSQKPIPLSNLAPDVLASFESQILSEVQSEVTTQNDQRTHRSTREYGYSFFKMEKNDFSYTPPPEFLQKLGAEVAKSLKQEPTEFTNIILSVYNKSFHLEPHVDVSKKDRYGDAQFYFGENVYGLVVEPDPTGHLYFVEWNDKSLAPPLNLEKIYEVPEEKGSTFCLQGDYRESPYFHGVSEVTHQRISLTFRTVIRTD
ncbi:MAG: hypothetical protein S4CHLAM7_02760 [Chlamydiae bacterium]|nr:hypothetical protein [Chlamydiota bacterium]